MGLDIRLPIGMLFTIFGIMLIVFGVFSNPYCTPNRWESMST